MDNDNFSILIVGLGLIGGSLAKALAGFRDCKIFAVDTDAATLKAAERDGVIEKGYAKIEEIAPKCQFSILCLHPGAVRNLLQTAPFRDNSLVTDVCGVKQYLTDSGSAGHFRYIGGHPMAGRECSGYENSLADLFHNSCYLFTPDADASAEDLAFLDEMARHIGCRKALFTTPAEHDKMIAYTSQLMHVVAAALCDNPLLDASEDYSAGSLRDCTRVAKLDAKMWTELFLINREPLAARINEFEDSLNKIKSALMDGDAARLEQLLKNCSERKRRYLNENTSSQPSKS